MNPKERLKVTGKARSEPMKAWPSPVSSSTEHPFIHLSFWCRLVSSVTVTQATATPH